MDKLPFLRRRARPVPPLLAVFFLDDKHGPLGPLPGLQRLYGPQILGFQLAGVGGKPARRA